MALDALRDRVLGAMRRSPLLGRAEDAVTSLALSAVFRAMDARLVVDPAYRALIHRPANGHPGDDWRAKLRLTTRAGDLDVHATIGGGRAHTGASGEPDATLVFRDHAAVRAFLARRPSEVLDMLLDGQLVLSGNLSDVARLSFMLTSLVARAEGPEVAAYTPVSLQPSKRALPMAPCTEAPHLLDPAFAALTLADFPRLARFKRDAFATTPEICTERPRLYTAHVRGVGFDDVPPAIRQAGAFRNVLVNKRPIVRAGDLLAGTTTSKPVGVVVYPECGGVTIWPELRTVSRRKLNPYRISDHDVQVLNGEVFPFWRARNVREWARARHGNPRSLQLDERFALYFQWKTQAISHTIPDLPSVLSRGLHAISEDAATRAAKEDRPAPRLFYESVQIAVDGVLTYSRALSAEAARLAALERDEVRRAELDELARICAKVPAEPAATLHEALQSIWITWIGCHMENTNAGLSLGRLDQWLQPFFEADLAKLPRADAGARHAYVKRAIELVGCFYLRCADHVPQVADLGNKLFGGSSSDQAITLGGVDAKGRDAVNDLTYVFLKVTELLGVRDPNVNARYHEGVNSIEYLRRLCEVNLITGATPSIHNDAAIVDVLERRGMTKAHARDWSATGCVEPTSSGRHYGHTGCLMFNLVAPLEMVLRDGVHPLLAEQVGPRTGAPNRFETFDALLSAYFEQVRAQIELAVHANTILAEAHCHVRPTPFLSAIFEGPFDRGVDLVAGGALYNSTGVANVGLVEVVDSLAAIRDVVFERKRCDLKTLVAALDADFDGHAPLLAWIDRRAPKFGSGHASPREIADRILVFCDETFGAQPHHRGGQYRCGYWSMSNHVAFGTLAGALPSGRRRGKPFTPGLTPSPSRQASIVEHIHDVSALDHRRMPNNIAFNVKVVPAPTDTQARSVDAMAAYARTFVQQGGMQIQFNVVSSATLRDAMAHPENYRTLMVRISGYNAYFVDLNDDLKRELIDRAEHRL
ncbi:MAG: pyruvate formate lyase family protein [Polyangiales bacterium]